MPTNNKTQLKTALNNWHVMPFSEKPTVIKQFTNGLNHHTYLLFSNDKKFVLKLFSQNASRAILAQEITSKKYLSPEILYVNENKDTIVMNYLSAETNKDNASITSLAQTLKEVHSLPYSDIEADLGRFDVLAFIKQYKNEIGKTDTLINNLDQQLTPVIDIYLNDPTPWRFCHNDLVKENCLISQNENTLKTLFIDWEYAQINNPWFDIASIIQYFKLNKKQTTQFIQNYQPSLAKQINSPIYSAAQCVVLWLDLLWHTANKTIQPINKREKLRQLKIQIKNHYKN